MKCLDTTFLIDLLKKDKDALKKAAAIQHEELMTTSINVFEVCAGIFRRNGEKEFELFRDLLGATDICPVDTDAAVLAGMMSGQLTRAGKQVQNADCLVAGAMLAKKCTTIITRDVEHFSRMKGIKVETY
jgi:tRNA(fMet)-specific endonuclease VapC